MRIPSSHMKWPHFMWERENTHLFFIFFRILNIFNIHTHGERGEGLKEIYSGVYPKWPNSWIYTHEEYTFVILRKYIVISYKKKKNQRSWWILFFQNKPWPQINENTKIGPYLKKKLKKILVSLHLFEA